jgi:hypothetical protein
MTKARARPVRALVPSHARRYKSSPHCAIHSRVSIDKQVAKDSDENCRGKGQLGGRQAEFQTERKATYEAAPLIIVRPVRSLSTEEYHDAQGSNKQRRNKDVASSQRWSKENSSQNEESNHSPPEGPKVESFEITLLRQGPEGRAGRPAGLRRG